MSGFSLPAKLIFAFFLVTIPSLATVATIGLYALWDLTKVNSDLQEISRSLEAVQGLGTAIEETETVLSAYLNLGGAGQNLSYQAAIQDVDDRLNACGNSTCHGSSMQHSAMAESLAPYIRGIKDQAAIVFAAPGPPTDRGKAGVLHQINVHSHEASLRLARMTKALLLQVNFHQQRSQEVGRDATGLILLTAMLVLALAAAIAWLLAQRLLNHVGALLTGTRMIMQGDLGYRVAVAQRDEIGQLAESFNAMAQEIQDHRENMERIMEARTVALKHAQVSVIQSEKLASIGLLAAGVGHELNNPLTSILMNVNLLIEDVGDQAALRAELQRISDDAVRCKLIIDDLRDFSRRHDLDVELADLNALVRAALGALERSVSLQGVTMVQELSVAMPPVPCDAVRMEQVFGNVLVNAVQAMPQGGKLKVVTTLREGYAEMSVQDSGPGIPEAIRDRIFDPFFTTKARGTGLGLSIVYRIMEAHGGRVAVENMADDASGGADSEVSGTRIVLQLPLTVAPAGSDVVRHRRDG